jgi:hypothetical protein
MTPNQSHFSLGRLSGILIGVYGLTTVYLVCLLTNSFYEGFAIFSQLPISFLEIGISILVTVTILLSFTTLWVRARRAAKKDNVILWNSLSKKLRFQTLIPILILAIILVIISNKGYYSFLTPLFLFFYGIVLLNLSRFAVVELKYLALAEIILAIVAFFILDKEIFFLSLGTGLFPILYGVLTFVKTTGKR